MGRSRECQLIIFDFHTSKLSLTMVSLAEEDHGNTKEKESEHTSHNPSKQPMNIHTTSNIV